MAIQLKDIQDAANRIAPYVRKTPVQPIKLPGGQQVFLKLENLQNTAAFKIRGACNFSMQLTDEQKKHGVTTGSSGNHAQGLACAANLLGIKCTVCMPSIAPKAKVNAARSFGAEVVLVDGLYNEACEYAHKLEKEQGMVYAPAFDHEWIIEGQGTLGLEVLDQIPECGRIIVPVGGGGMISGIAIAAKSIRPDIHIIGVEPETAACLAPSMKEHHLVELGDIKTIADGIVTKIACQQTLDYCEKYVDEIVTVTEHDIKEAILYLYEKGRVVAEGAGALPIAALLAGKVSPEVKEGPTVCILSGGNIDAGLMAQVIEELTAEKNEPESISKSA